MDHLFSVSRPRRTIAPGAVHIPGWLSTNRQRELVEQCREWARPPAPMRRTALPGGGRMSVSTVCLGWHWSPYRYTRTAVDVDDDHVPPVSPTLVDLGRSAVTDAYDDHAAGRAYEPDTALINFYDPAARMGMHRDKDERVNAPIVSISLGDACLFRFGNTESRGRPYTDVRLESGDLFVFGGPSRFAFHGVPLIHPGTGNAECGLTGGRLNITLRTTGLT